MLLTKNLCRDQFTVLQADIVFRTVFNAFRRQHIHVGDRLLASLQKRNAERKNAGLLSCLRFTSPLEYEPSEENGLLEITELRGGLKDLCSRLFPEPEPEPAEENLEPVAGPS